jgi:EmrB/QacA subfamily drug resistance transporter
MTEQSAPKRFGALLAVYLLGIFMGAIDTGIITPARTIVQNDLKVDDTTGIWMITIYTLAYAAAIPVMGKLADRYGRKPIYLISIALFGLGSLAAGLSQDVGSFSLLLAARAVQAIGGGGIVPIATAEFGTSVPEEKRGLALGLVGGVYGVANIFGSSAGSLILDIFGDHNWQFIFYVNVPISVVIIAAGLLVLPNHRAEKVARIDLLGIAVVVAMVTSLLYGLRNIDYFDLGNSLREVDVYPFLLAFGVLLPVLILVERRAEDPVLNLAYFTRRPILVTLLLSFMSGVILMGVVFVPQFAENALRIPTGSGGYFVIVLGLASGIGAPVSGQLTDRFGPQLVVGTGFGVSVVAALSGAFWAIPAPSWASVLTTLALMGLGLGFVVGSPINYMMLSQTPPEESNSALATLSLIRSIGTTIAPAFLVGFLAHAGTQLADNLTAQLPHQVSAPALPYAAELQAKFTQLKSDPQLKDKLKNVEFPDLNSQTTINIDTTSNSGATLAPDLVELLKTADVTTIVQRSKVVAERQFATQTPSVIADITNGVNTGLDSLATTQTDLAKAEEKLTKAISGISSGIDGMTKAATGMRSGIAGMTKAINGMDAGLAGMTKGVEGAGQGVSALQAQIDQTTAQLRTVQTELADLNAQLSALDPTDPQFPVLQASLQGQIAAKTGQIAGYQGQLVGLQAAVDQASGKLSNLKQQRATLAAQRAVLAAQRAKLSRQLATIETKLASAKTSRSDLISAHDQLVTAQADLADTSRKLTILRDAVPSAFETAKNTYLAEIDARGPLLEQTFVSTLNTGFFGIFTASATSAILAVLLLLAYPRRRRVSGDPDRSEIADRVAA